MSLFGKSEEIRLLERVLEILGRIERQLEPKTPTPTAIHFKENTMLAPDPGNTLVFTGTLSPTGSAFPAGTTFTAVSADPNVTVTLDETGLIVTAAISETDTPGTVADITWSTSSFAPEPSTSPASLTVTIPLTIGAPPPPPTPTPTGVTFEQTT
jgi:hypothetical protein